MDKEDRVLAAQAGLIVLGEIESLVRRGEVLMCTRALEVVNRTREDVLIDSVVLRAAGWRALARPPYRYPVIHWLKPGARRTILSERLLQQMQDQPQAEEAVRPFESRLNAPGALGGPLPQVIVRVQLTEQVVEISVPVLQLASDAKGRLIHLPPPNY
ncbi:hypothetical protein HNQ07_004155 [Deinococcus metalli]|uniref:Uncharacterized protein n=1 Tax=Deinococcus metalli TaxID=1141878 RepID=A0A7W8NT33_9DEIO|nr:hypothetical protein [Deinococcus metalli]MBB5378648.1 hypothetical protein [Deinococcus metalli]GHF61399.1 hypothetical protein GCM10017781_41960 [Deinococcus metalli]